MNVNVSIDYTSSKRTNLSESSRIFRCICNFLLVTPAGV